MKNFGIENTERKNIYNIPDGFFEQMQTNVLKEIQPKQQAKIIRMNWVYAAAAAIALIFGLAFLMNPFNKTSTSSVAEIASTENPAKNIIKNVAKTISKTPQQKLSVHESQSVESVPMTTQKNETKQANNSRNEIRQNPEMQMEQIIASFTSAEMADLSRNAEQDIYLDLYN